MDTTSRRGILNPESFGLDNSDLIKHFQAHEHLSHTGSEVKLKKIPAALRTQCSKFYKDLRKNGIYPHHPSGDTMKFVTTNTDYYLGWQKYMRNQPDKPEWQFITIEEVKKLIHNSTQEIKKSMAHRINLGEDLDQAVKTPKSLKPLIEDIPF